MLNGWVLFAISTGYVAVLFAIAYLGDRRAQVVGPPLRKPWIYSLALCVYCTSWTFYGAVGRAAGSGWDFLPIYLGPIVVFLFGGPLLRRIIRISKRHNITSIADFIGARYGRHQPIAMLVTAIAVIGVLPYIALQLKAVSFGFEVLVGAAAGTPHFMDGALTIAMMLAAFAILFGTRDLVSTENHHGMVLAIAFESLVKLAAFLALGLYATYVLSDGLVDAYSRALALAQVSMPSNDATWRMGFVSQTLLAAIAIICLPRQFHIAVVENTSLSDLRTSRWVFPLYLSVISLFVLPIAAAGVEFLGGSVPSDTFVLELPLVGNHPWLALGAYLGGFSAATGMIVVETIALSTMICNEIVMPVLLRSQRLPRVPGQDLSGLIKLVRRVGIVLIVALAYAYFRMFTGPGTLTQIGLLSFAAVAQFAPSLIGGVLWRGGRYPAVVAGLMVGSLMWGYTLLTPALLRASDHYADILRLGPFGIDWLKPEALFGVSGMDAVTHGVFWSLAFNLAAYFGVSLLRKPGLRERLQAAKFLEEAVEARASEPNLPRSSATVGDLQELVERFLGSDRAAAVFAEYSSKASGGALERKDHAGPELARFVEHLLAGVLGTSSARLVLGTTLRGRDMQPEDVVRLLDETSHVIQFNRELLRAALENLSQGVSVVDANLCLVAWNRRYLEMFDYPAGLVVRGRPIEDLMRFNAERGWLVSANAEAAVARRLAYMRAGRAYSHERELPDGTVLDIVGNPMPGGGFVTSFSDVTAYKRAQKALQEANETLEFRVRERTRELTDLNVELADAKVLAERANDAKTRFLAAASHDLVQPLTAARLFVSSIDRDQVPPPTGSLVAQAESALITGENLLGGLLDISRLDGGAQEVRLEHFPLNRVIGPLVAEFKVLARDRGLRLRVANCDHVVYSDPHLLRRVLQNFLSNAVRYTRHGRVLVGCRRRGRTLDIEVWDSGPGIPEEKRKEIFEEFRRLGGDCDAADRGLGLGLAIVDRIVRMLDYHLSLRSWPGRGSVFAISVPVGDGARISSADTTALAVVSDRLMGRRVLCMENEPAVLSGIQALLSNWGCETVAVRDRESAIGWAMKREAVPDLLLVDYHLDRGISGLDLAEEMQSLWGTRVPSIVITADHTLDAHTAATAHGCRVLRKPVKPAALRAVMNSMLA
ncbi:MAG TPA: NahK/ErcS family hybrid sensor histidine kinase/response regulator [Burkholderiaceae bacterium]|nr:NahK/ErcS family hybrid sensor histidine kinase/response regulator [Burkholderiaceae bacterium]